MGIHAIDQNGNRHDDDQQAHGQQGFPQFGDSGSLFLFTHAYTTFLE